MPDLDVGSPELDYISKHWMGNLSLTKSFWLNLVLVNVVASLSLGLAAPWIRGAGAMVGLMLFASGFLIWIWSAVGTWRSAIRYNKPPDAKIWGRLACAVVILQALKWFADTQTLFV